MEAIGYTLKHAASNLSATSVGTERSSKAIMDIKQDVSSNLRENMSTFYERNKDFYQFFCENCTIDYQYYDYDSFQEFSEMSENVVVVFFGLILLSGLIGNSVVVR